MLSPVRAVFRSVEVGEEDETGHEERVSLPVPVRLRAIYAKGIGLLGEASPGDLYRIRIYAGNPQGSCWQLELVASSLGEGARTPDVLHQGLDLYLPGTFWVTYQLLAARAEAGARLTVEMLLET